MKRKRKNAILVAILASLGLVAWLIVLDFGVNAGRIHRGVQVGDVDIGGSSEVEAFRELNARAQLLLEKPNVFTAENVQCSFYAEELGWGPQVASTVDRAYAIGREGGFLGNLWERFEGWSGEHHVGWAGRANARKVGTFIAQCDKQAEAFGVQIDRPRMRFLVKRAIVTFPEKIFEIPLEEA